MTLAPGQPLLHEREREELEPLHTAYVQHIYYAKNTVYIRKGKNRHARFTYVQWQVF